MKIDRFFIITFVLFSILHSLIGTKDNLILLRITQLIGLISFIRVITYYKGLNQLTKSKKSKLFLFFLTCILSSFFIELLHGRFYFAGLIYPISFYSIAVLIIKSKPDPKIYVLISISVFLYLLYLFYTGLNPNEWVNGSRNHVSVVVIYITVLAGLIAYIKGTTHSFLIYFVFPLISVILSIFALGRSGIITTLILFLVSVYFLFSNKDLKSLKKVILRLLVFTSLLATSYFTIINTDYLLDAYLYKFERSGMDLAERSDVISLYFDKLDIYAFFLSYRDLDFIYSYEGITLHNSYLSWHYNYGIGVFFLFYIILTVMFDFFKKSIYFYCLLLVIFLRSFSDQILLTDGILLGLPFMLIILINDNYTMLRKKD